MMKTSQKKIGQSIIEIIIAMSLLAILMPVLIAGIATSREGKAQQKRRLQAVMVMQEAQEVVRNVRDESWEVFAVDGIFHPVVNELTHQWELQTGQETLPSAFTRSILIESVQRNDNGDIVPSGGTWTDASTKRVIITVSWDNPIASSITSQSYLTRHKNIFFTETSKADFDEGVFSDTVSRYSLNETENGEVVLGSGSGGGDWCDASQSITTVNLSRQGIPTAISALQGHIVTGTGGNASGPTFSHIIIGGNEPPIATVEGEFDNSKANGVFRDPNDFAYIATDTNAEEVQILDLNQYSNPPQNNKYLKVGYFNAPGNLDGKSVYILGNVGYMTSNNYFYTFDVNSKSGSRPRLGSYTLQLAGNGVKIQVVEIGGNIYAFVAIASNSTQMQVINVTDPTNPSIVAQVQTGSGQSGVDVAVNATGTRAYLVTSYSSSSKEFFIINTSDLSGNLPLIGSGFDTDGMSPKGVAIATGNRIVVVGTGGAKQYVVISVDNENVPTACGPGLTISGGAYDVATVLQDDGYAYSYVITGDTNAELKIIQGGGGGDNYATSGTFESAIFSTDISTAFNSFKANIVEPVATNINMQVAVANEVNGSCESASYYFVGPNGDPDAYFETGSEQNVIKGAIPIGTFGNYINPGWCFRYKAYLTTEDESMSPILYEVTVNYSP